MAAGTGYYLLKLYEKGYVKGDFEEVLNDICGKPKNYISNLSAWFFEDGTSVQKIFGKYTYVGGGSGPPRYDD